MLFVALATPRGTDTNWDDVFQITIVPVVNAEEGMRFATERLAHQELAVR